MHKGQVQALVDKLEGALPTVDPSQNTGLGSAGLWRPASEHGRGGRCPDGGARWAGTRTPAPTVRLPAQDLMENPANGLLDIWAIRTWRR